MADSTLVDPLGRTIREDGSNRLVGVTAVNWWKRFGRGQLPDSLREIQKVIEPLAQKLAGK